MARNAKLFSCRQFNRILKGTAKVAGILFKISQLRLFFRMAYNLSLSQYFVSVTQNYKKEIGNIRTAVFFKFGIGVIGGNDDDNTVST